MIEALVPALRRYAAVLVKGQQEQDDLVHDCLVRALDRFDMRRDESKLRPWLFAIMHNLFISQMRNKRRRGRVETLDRAGVEACRIPPGQERQIELHETLRALSALPEEQRQVLVLVAIEDLSYDEVAQVLGVPIGTVMSRLARGRERLRRTVEARLGQQ